MPNYPLYWVHSGRHPRHSRPLSRKGSAPWTHSWKKSRGEAGGATFVRRSLTSVLESKQTGKRVFHDMVGSQTLAKQDHNANVELKLSQGGLLLLLLVSNADAGLRKAVH